MEELASRFSKFGIKIKVRKTKFGGIITFPEMKKKNFSLIGRISGYHLTLFQRLGEDNEQYNLGRIDQLKDEQIMVIKILIKKMLKNS